MLANIARRFCNLARSGLLILPDQARFGWNRAFKGGGFI
jgi:hypothetical protein